MMEPELFEARQNQLRLQSVLCLVYSTALAAAGEPAILPLVFLQRYSRFLYAVLSDNASSKTEDKTFSVSCPFTNNEIRTRIKNAEYLLHYQVIRHQSWHTWHGFQ